MNKKGFTLVELMVVVAIVAILAAVALPMYSTFKQKAYVSTVIKSCSGANMALQNWFANHNSFGGVSVGTNGGSLVHNNVRLGAGLPEIEDLNWEIVSPTNNSVRITWQFLSKCPAEVCNGYWELICDETNDRCDVAIRLDAANTLGLAK